MIIESKKKDNKNDLISKIQYLKKKYSPEELKSIVSQMEDPFRREIARKLLNL